MPPQKEDVLFRADSNWPGANACLSITHGREYSYTEGYRTAARLLAAHAVDTCHDQDILIFPIVYLFRHHIELILKSLTVTGAFVIGKALSDAEIKDLGKHRLDGLWTNLKPILHAAYEEAQVPPIPQEVLEGVDAYIRQLTDVDADSFSFRYASSKKGVPSVPRDLRYINIRVFSDAMERLSYFLGGVGCGLTALKDAKNEWLAECEREEIRCSGG